MDEDNLNNKIQLQIPSEGNNLAEPEIFVFEDNLANNNPAILGAFGGLFEQVAQSYQNDPAALHRFSYLPYCFKPKHLLKVKLRTLEQS